MHTGFEHLVHFFFWQIFLLLVFGRLVVSLCFIQSVTNSEHSSYQRAFESVDILYGMRVRQYCLHL